MAAPLPTLSGKPAVTKPAPSSGVGGLGSPPSEGVSKLLDNFGGLKLEPTPPSQENEKLNLLVTGDKDAGKSVNIVMFLPRPSGGKTYVITFDETTRRSLDTFCTRMGWDPVEAQKDIVVYEVVRKQVRVVGMDTSDPQNPKPITKVVYEGYDPNRTFTGALVLGTVMKLLENFEKAGDADNVVLDHFQAGWENVGVTYGRYEEKVDPAAESSAMGKKAMGVYEARARMLKLIEAKARSVAKHACVLTGYGASERVVVEEGERSDGSKRTEVSREVVMPKWLAPDTAAAEIARNYHAYIHFRRTLQGDSAVLTRETVSTARYWAEVLMSKVPRFPLGKSIEVTNKGVGVFWERPKDPVEALEEVTAAAAAKPQVTKL